MWKEIPGTNGNYSANSETGQIRSNDRLGFDGRRLKGQLIKPYTINSGYDMVYLRVNGKYIDMLVHRAIAKTFLPNYSESLEINHKDCNKRNNKLENLEVVTRRENINHAIKNGLIDYTSPKRLASHKALGELSKKNNSKEVFQIDKNTNKVIRSFYSVREASRCTGISSDIIYSNATEKSNSGEYIWKYAKSMKCND